MDGERDENKEELKPHAPEEVKVESSVISPAIGPLDVSALHHNSDSERQFSEKNDEYESLDPVDARHLDSVYQYTSKIRQFIGLIDPEEDKPAPIPSPESESEKGLSDETTNQNLENNDGISEKLNLDESKNDPDLTKTDDGVPVLSNSSPPNNNSDAKEPAAALSLEESYKEFWPLGVNNEKENPSEDNNETAEQKSLPVITEEAERPILDNSVNKEDEQNDLSNEISQQSLTDDANEALTDAGTEEISSELDVDSNMPNHIPEDKMNAPLLESDEIEISNNGIDLNKPEDVLKNEEIISSVVENKSEKDMNSNASVHMNQEHTAINLVETENSKMLNEPSEEEQNISSIEDSNILEDNVPKHLYNELYAISEEQDSCVTPDEIEKIPHFDDIRRLSVEIVNKVLDTAGNQLRDILNEKRKSNADANNLEERSPDLEIVSFSDDGTVKASKSEAVKVSLDKDNTNLSVNEGGSSQLSEQSELKQKLNNEIQLKEVLAKTYDFNDFQKKIEVEMNKFDPKYDVDPDIVCGIGCFKPRWIQPWATSRVYLILYSIIGILSGSYYSYLIGAMSTLEKRFAFKSKTSGFVMMLDEITPLLLGIFIGYFGGKSHRPRMVGLGMLLSSICCFISALPYFIYGPATHLSLGYSTVDNEKKLELCNVEEREGFCDDEDRLPTLTPVLLLMLGSFLKGFGNLAYYAVGLAYMDDNAKKKNTPMYFAIAFSLRLLGPMVGFLMSSFFLKYYENPFVDPGFETSDPRWIGCWWMGFLVQGVLLLIFTIPISLFPRRLPGTVDYSKSDEDNQLTTSFVGLFAALKRLAKNPVYCLIVLNAIMGIFGSFGHYIMLPRYMENQFRLSASTSNLISGPPSIGAVMISMTIGGYLIWKFKPGAKFLAGALCASELMQTCAYLILMIPRCQRVEMTSYGFNNDGLILQDECNSNCNCTTNAFSPVCGPDGATMFFSPCHAGCSQKVNGTYWNCSCVFDSSGQQRDYVTDGFCVTENCWPSILAYILTMPVIQLVVNLSKVGHTIIFLRSIKPEDKSVALGTFETLICTFGFIPYPVVYGALVDSACLIWEKSCGETGNCWYYDVPKLNYLLHGTSALFSTFDACTLLGIFFLASRVHDLYKEDYETEDSTNTVKNEAESQEERKDNSSIIKL
ncbi:solute carrier organic anion transporter family member 6C1-like [Argiope bruennichi]|uniref:solute carrier organic anion transporter family member 6C1-like n=1 Tax=Argiope bruennichi TaxID=94029 RepID=UPI002494FA5C|nr:solute carrier organic anion transporter family member 6C1-like [Argiope bruennichi]